MTTASRYNLWAVSKGLALVIAYEYDANELRHFMRHRAADDADDGVRFVILPDGEEPAVLA